MPDNVKAPIVKGDRLGTAQLTDVDGKVIDEVNLVAKTDVNAKTYWDYIRDIVCER